MFQNLGHRTHADGGHQAAWYRASAGRQDVHDLFTDRDEKRHSIHRRKVAALYSMTNLLQFEPFVGECTEIMMTKIKIFARSGQSFNLQHWLQCYAFDVIGLITV